MYEGRMLNLENISVLNFILITEYLKILKKMLLYRPLIQYLKCPCVNVKGIV